MSDDDRNDLLPLPASDKEGTQRIYDALAGELQSMPEEIRRQPRFPFWAIIAVINLLCRLAVTSSGMTKEQLLRQVGDIFTGYKEGRVEKKLLN